MSPLGFIMALCGSYGFLYLACWVWHAADYKEQGNPAIPSFITVRLPLLGSVVPAF